MDFLGSRDTAQCAWDYFRDPMAYHHSEPFVAVLAFASVPVPVRTQFAVDSAWLVGELPPSEDYWPLDL